MGYLLRRRALMMANSAVPSVTEINWDFSMGSPQNYGIVRTTNGTVDAESIDTNGVKMSTRQSSASIAYRLPYNAETGWVEYSFKTPSPASWNIYCRLSDGETGLAATGANSSSASYWNVGGTQLSTPALSRNAIYSVKIEMSGGIANVYINGTLVRGDINVSTSLTATEFTFQSWSGNNRVAYLRSIKAKFGSL